MTFEVKLLITFVATDPLVILTKFGWNPIKHVEEEANCEKKEEEEEERKKLDMRPLPRARVKLGGWTRSPRFWWKKPFDPCDPKSKCEPISFEEGSTWCICMSYIDKYVT